MNKENIGQALTNAGPWVEQMIEWALRRVYEEWKQGTPPGLAPLDHSICSREIADLSKACAHLQARCRELGDENIALKAARARDAQTAHPKRRSHDSKQLDSIDVAEAIKQQTIPGRILERLHSTGPEYGKAMGPALGLSQTRISNNCRALMRIGYLQHIKDKGWALVKPLDCLPAKEKSEPEIASSNGTVIVGIDETEREPGAEPLKAVPSREDVRLISDHNAPTQDRILAFLRLRGPQSLERLSGAFTSIGTNQLNIALGELFTAHKITQKEGVYEVR